MALFYSPASSKATSKLPPVVINKVTLSNEQVDAGRSKSARPELATNNSSKNLEPTPTKVELDLKIGQIERLKKTGNLNKIKIYVQENYDQELRTKIYDFDDTLIENALKLQNGEYFLKHVTEIPYEDVKNLSFICWLQLVLHGEPDKQTDKYSGPKNREIVIEAGEIKRYVNYREITTYGTNQRQHYHNIRVDADGNGYALSGGRFNVGHQHQIVNGVVQVAENHAHSLIEMGSVTDNRAFKEGKTRSLDVVRSSDFKTKKAVYLKVSSSLKLTDKYSNFSELWSTKDTKGDQRSIFSFNPISILRENSIFNSLYTEENVRNGIFEEYKPSIKDIKIYRDRIKGNSSLGTNSTLSSNPVSNFKEPIFGKKTQTKQVGGYQKFDKNESEELIIFSSQKNNSNTIDSFKQSKRSDSANSIKEMNGISANSDFRYISFNDKSIKQKNNGFFQYRTMINLQDPGLVILDSHLQEISQHKEYVNEFYQAIKSSPSAIKDPVGDPSTSDTNTFTTKQMSKMEVDIRNNVRGEEQSIYKKAAITSQEVQKSFDKNSSFSKMFEKREYAPRNYDERTGKYSKTLSLGPKYSSNSRVDKLSAPSIAAIDSYFKISKFYNNDLKEKKLNKKSLYIMLSPKYGNPDGVLSFLTLLQDLIKDINSFVELSKKGHFDKNSGIARTSDGSPLQKSAKTIKNNVIEISNIFSETIKADETSNSGFDFMNIGETNDLGIKEVSRDKLNEIVNFELSKIYDTESGDNLDTSIEGLTPGDNVNTTKFAYFTPTKIKMGTMVDLTNGSSKPSFGNSLDYTQIAIKTKLTNRGANTSTKSNSYIQATNTIQNEKLIKKETSDDCGPKTESKNRIEKENIDDKNRLSSDINNSFLFSKMFSDIEGITVVNPEESPRGKKNNFFAGKSPVSNIAKEYKEKDLENKRSLDFDRAARPIFDSLSKNCDENKLNMNNFNINSDKSKLKKSLNEWANKPGTPSEFIRNAPNQVKALLKAKSASFTTEAKVPFRKEFSEMVKEDVNEKNTDQFRYKLKTINKLEVLTSFDGIIQKGNQNQLKESEVSLPKWQTLTPEILEQHKGKDLMARMVPYENKEFEIKRDKDYELPTFDEYFVIKGN